MSALPNWLRHRRAQRKAPRCLVGAGRNSVYPHSGAASTAVERMTEPTSNGHPSQESGGGGGDGGRNEDNNPPPQQQQQQEQQDQMEMGRLQAILEARGLPSHIWGALGPRMQSLLGRQPQHTPNSKIQPLLAGIQKSEDESQQLQSVIELCNILVMGNEDTLGSHFPVKDVVRALTQLLQMEHNYDVMNHACRAITYLMEALPRSTPLVVEAIPQLIERLHRIECMDVAEQALTALELLSRRHAKSILVAGGISACLSYLDFFSLVPQRTSLQIAANCCAHLSSDDFHYVKDNLALLTQRLLVQDKKSVESVCTLFTRLVDNFLAQPDKLRAIAEHGLLKNVQQLVVVSPPLISTGIFVSIIRMTHLLCSHSTELAVQLLNQDVVETLRYLLVGSADPTAPDIELVARTPQEQHEIVVLIGELLPRLPKDGIFEVDHFLRRQPAITDHVVWSWKDDRGLWRPYTPIDSRILEAAYQARETEVNLNAMGNTYTVDIENLMQINDETGTSRNVHRRVTPQSHHSSVALSVKENGKDERLQLLEKDGKVIRDFIRSLFAVLYEVYSASAGPAIRHECLRSILRMVYHSDAELLKDVLKNLTVSSHIANMLSSNDMKIVVGAVQLTFVLIEKVPEIFTVYFRREGVLHQVEKLIKLPSPPSTSDAPHKSASDPALPNQNQADPLGLGPPTERSSALSVGGGSGDGGVLGVSASGSVFVDPPLPPPRDLRLHAPPGFDPGPISFYSLLPGSLYGSPAGTGGLPSAAPDVAVALGDFAAIPPSVPSMPSCRFAIPPPPQPLPLPSGGSLREEKEKKEKEPPKVIKKEVPSDEPMDTSEKDLSTT